MAYRLEPNLLSFGFHNSLVNTFLQVFNNASLDVNVPTVAESSQDLTQDALYLNLCIAAITVYFYHLIRGRRLLTFPPHVRRLIEGGAYSSK